VICQFHLVHKVAQLDITVSRQLHLSLIHPVHLVKHQLLVLNRYLNALLVQTVYIAKKEILYHQQQAYVVLSISYVLAVTYKELAVLVDNSLLMVLLALLVQLVNFVNQVYNLNFVQQDIIQVHLLLLVL